MHSADLGMDSRGAFPLVFGATHRTQKPREFLGMQRGGNLFAREAPLLVGFFFVQKAWKDIPTGQIIGDRKHDLFGPQKVAEEGKSPYFRKI